MNITGIIAEYNPFHNGHLYQIEQIKNQQTDYIIIIMSGDFLQRGTPAILDKWTRTQMALSSGADLVIELPAVFATASAQYFARGGISILDKLGVVDSLCFGCETNDPLLLQKCASYLMEEPVEYRKKLQACLKDGNSFPKARVKALSACLGTDAAEFVSSPNNILALEYCIALSERNSSINPMPILRKGKGYHDTQLTKTFLPSASAVRSYLADNQNISDLTNYLPQCVLSIINENADKLLLSQDVLSLLIKYKLLSKIKELEFYADVTKDLADKIRKNINCYENLSQFIDLLKSKDLTYTRINRALTHILLDITQDMYVRAKEQDYAAYARILGFQKRALPLLSEIRNNTSVPLITKLADARKQLSAADYTLLEQDIFCSHVYESIIQDKTGMPFQNEFTRQIIIYE